MKKNLLATLVSLGLGISLASAQSLPAYVPTLGLVGFYPLDGNAKDLSTSANDGITTGCTATTDRNGKINGAYNFNGTSDYVTVFNDSRLNPNGAITVSAWIKATAFAAMAYDNTIVGKDDWSFGNEGYVLRCGDAGKLGFNIAKNSNTWEESLTATAELNTNNWFFVTGVYDGTSIKTYVNGMLKNTLPSTGALVSSYVSLLIGSCPGPAGGRFFNGKIDDVGIWSRALSATEIMNMFSGTVTGIKTEQTGLSLSAFPNPATTELTVVSDLTLTGAAYSIKDLFGRVVEAGKITGTEVKVDISVLESGVYFLQTQTATPQVLKIVKD